MLWTMDEPSLACLFYHILKSADSQMIAASRPSTASIKVNKDILFTQELLLHDFHLPLLRETERKMDKQTNEHNQPLYLAKLHVCPCWAPKTFLRSQFKIASKRVGRTIQ